MEMLIFLLIHRNIAKEDQKEDVNMADRKTAEKFPGGGNKLLVVYRSILSGNK